MHFRGQPFDLSGAFHVIFEVYIKGLINFPYKRIS